MFSGRFLRCFGPFFFSGLFFSLLIRTCTLNSITCCQNTEYDPQPVSPPSPKSSTIALHRPRFFFQVAGRQCTHTQYDFALNTHTRPKGSRVMNTALVVVATFRDRFPRDPMVEAPPLARPPAEAPFDFRPPGLPQRWGHCPFSINTRLILLLPIRYNNQAYTITVIGGWRFFYTRERA